MRISSLQINDLRVIEEMKLQPGPGINFIVGANGAGKTSVLEAIYLAGRGRTFRHAEAGPMIRVGAEASTVLLEIQRDPGSRCSLLGVRRERRSLLCRLDGRDVRKRSELAEALPVLWIGSQPQLFLGMGPDVRRRFIDMGLFHVEHSYLGALADFQRTLRQRNAAIKQGSTDGIRLWNQPFSRAALAIHESRQRFLEALMAKATTLISDWQPGYTIDYRYRAGWSGDRPFVEQLEDKIETDQRMGFTTRGPHRAELEILADGVLAEKKLSRGQQKLLVFALNLALMDLVSTTDAMAPVLLVDDLAAELDLENRSRLIAELTSRPCQAFIAKIEDAAVLAPSGTSTATFHVEHGALK